MDCLALTGAELPVAGGIAAIVLLLIGAVAFVWSMRRNSVRGALAIVGLLLLTGVGVGGTTPASAADCPTASPTATPAPTLTGTWSGPVTDDAVPPYQLTAVFTDDGTTASAIVSYDLTPQCQGTWTQTARTATMINFTENITDPLACAINGTLTLTFDPTLTSLHYKYFHSPTDYPGYPYLPQATLTRVP